MPAESSPIGGRAGVPQSKQRGPVVVACILAVVGIGFAGHGVYLHAKAALGQFLLARAWTSMQAGGAMRPWPWADTRPVARLSVPEHGIELLVLEGANARTLAWGPGHVEGTPAPGRDGNAVVTAHRDTHFAFLKDLAPGTRVVVESSLGTRRDYRVERIFIADHKALELPAGDGNTLSLVTCYPFEAVDPATPLRYAVIARAE